MTQSAYPVGYSSLEQRLGAFGAFRKRWACINAQSWFVILGPGALLALVLIDWLSVKLNHPLPWYLLLSFFFIAAVLTVYGLIKYAVVPLLARIDIDREALVIESLHGSLDNQVIGSLQLSREVVAAQASGQSLGYSVAIVSALVTRTSDNVGRLNLSGLVDRKRTFQVLGIAGGIFLGFLLLGVLAPRVLADRADRLRDAYITMMDLMFPVKIEATCGHVVRMQTSVTLGMGLPTMEITSEDVSVVRGAPVFLGVEIAHARRKNVTLIRTDLKAGSKPTTVEVTLDSANKFITEPFFARESFTYQFENGGRRSRLQKVLVGDVPEVTAMNTELTYPAYTGMASRTLVGKLPKIQALVGTDGLVSIASTVDLDPGGCYVQFSEGVAGQKSDGSSGRLVSQPVGMTVSGRFAHFEFHVDKTARVATLHLTGALGRGFEMPEPIIFKIEPQPDNLPTVELLMSPKSKALGSTADGMPMLAEEAAHFSLSAIAEDDFGVAEMSLEYKIDTKDVHIENLPKRDPKGYVVTFRIDPPQERAKRTFAEIFKDLAPPLAPGERVTLSVTARDNNPSPPLPGYGRSSPNFVFTIFRPDLGSYVEQQFGFGNDPLLGGLRRVQRATNLLIEAERTTRTEAKASVEKQDVKSRVGAENWPGGSQDAVGQYFRLLSGEK